MASVRFASLADAKEALAKGSEESGKDIANYTDVSSRKATPLSLPQGRDIY